MTDATSVATLPDGIPPDVQTTAIAVIVAPERVDEVIPAIPAGPALLQFIWFCEEIIRRANTAKKYALAEAAMALDRMELTDPRIVVGGHTHMLRQDSRIVWDDLVGLAVSLHDEHRVPWGAIMRAASEMRVTELRELIEKHAVDRAAALDLVEEHRKKVPTQLALVDLDDPYRKGTKFRSKEVTSGPPG